MKLNILQLADLHCNEEDELYLRRIGKGLCEDLSTQAAAGLRPDIVCVTGDLVNKGQNAKTEYQLAEAIFLRPLQQQLSISHNSFFLAPGNHDVDRTQISKAFEAGFGDDLIDEGAFRAFYQSSKHPNADFDILRKKLDGYFAFMDTQKHDFLKHSSFFYKAYAWNHKGTKIGIVSLNDTWRSSQYGEDNGRLIIGEHTVLESVANIKDCDLRICICHHPFEMLASWDFKPVRQTVAKHFHVLLNGHVHDSDASLTQLILGSLFVSTAGCLKANEQFSSYTLIELDTERQTITTHLRKWYSDRETFDQETAKAKGGIITFPGFGIISGKASVALQIAVVRGKIQAEGKATDLVCPMDGFEDVELVDVFVEPMLSNKSGFDRDTGDRKAFGLNDLLKSDANLLIAGRPEFGKTTIMRYAKDFLLMNDRLFETTIPVTLKFGELPKNNFKKVNTLIAKALGQAEHEVASFAALGQLTILVDDFNDRRDVEHDKRLATFREFYKVHSKCRYILFATEHLSQPLQFELSSLAASFNARISYIGSLNTARIRQLLQKWKAKQDFDLSGMLNHILYYFQHCQIPVTPLSVILFLGVLHRKKKDRNIRNEAFLIENYLETILEKVNPNNAETDLDFRDKEDFLAAIAWQMVQREKQMLDVNEFERIKLDYFEKQDEDVPHHSFFETLFKKGILVRDEGCISFRRRFWFHFFLAKALEGDDDTKEALLARPDVLKYSKALAYKAGLSRKDVSLLRWVDVRAMGHFQVLIDKYSTFELRGAGKDAQLHEISKAIEQEIRARNSDEEVDKRRDEMYLCYDEDKGHLDEQQLEQIDNLLSLQSDIIRNTTKISVADKRRFIENNISCYVALMWAGIDIFKELLSKTDEEELFKLFFKGKKDATLQQKLRFVIQHAQRIVSQVVPLSVLVYMNDHLASPKLIKSFRQLALQTESETKKLFYHLLILGQKPKDGLRTIEKFITAESNLTEDFIICGFLRSYCYENKVDDDILNKIVAIMDSVRLKYIKRVKTDPHQSPYLKDSFRADTKMELRSKHIS